MEDGPVHLVYVARQALKAIIYGNSFKQHILILLSFGRDLTGYHFWTGLPGNATHIGTRLVKQNSTESTKAKTQVLERIVFHTTIRTIYSTLVLCLLCKLVVCFISW